MANKAIDRAFLVDALNKYNERLDTAVVGATTADITAADGIATLTVIDKDGAKQSTLVAAINELDRKQGDDELTVVDTKESKTEAETDLSAAINVLDKELGENKDFSTDIDDKTTVVAAINSVFKQGQVNITEDTTNTELLKTYIFTQGFEADNTTPHEIGRIELAKDLVVTSGECIIATGTEVREDGSPFSLEADKSYLKLTIANQVDPVYIDTRDLVNDYTTQEDATQIQLTISATREISATVVPASITHTEVDTPINNELAFTGFDHTLGTGASQLTTEAQTLREAVNELDAKQGDEELTVVDTLGDKTDPETTISASVNVLDKEMGDMAIVSKTPSFSWHDGPKELKNVTKDAAHYFEFIFNRIGWQPFLGWPDGGGDGVYPRTNNIFDTEDAWMAARGSSSHGHNYYGDHFWAYIRETGSLAISTGFDGSHYSWAYVYGAAKMGNLAMLHTWNKDTIVGAINSALNQLAVSIEDTPIDPTDPDYAKVAHRYVFKQNYPEGTDPAVPTTVIGTIDIEKPKFVKSVTTFKSDGTEIDPQTGLPLIEGHFYMKMEIENQEDPIYIDLNQLITDFVVEDTDHVDMTLEEKEVGGEKMRVVSADIVPNTLGHTEFEMSTNAELDFIGFDHASGDGSPEHFEICPPGTAGALTVVTGAPQENEVSLERVETINKLAGFGQKIIVGDTVLHKDAVAPGTTQLTTIAQNLRDAVNELNATKTVTVTATAEPLPVGVAKSYDINQSNSDGTVDKKGTIEIPYSNYTAAADPVTVQVTIDNADDKRTISAEVIDASLGKTKLDADVNAILDAVPTKLHIISATTYEDFVANILPDANIPANSAVILTNKFKIGDTSYMAGTWAYKAISADGTVTWQYMNNGGEMETIIIDMGTNPLPQPTTPEEIAAIKTNAIYVVEDDHGDKKSYIYLKRSTTVPASNEWLQISAGDKGIEWMGTYNYTATTTIIDPDTGLPTTKVVPWEATPEQLAGMTTWFVTKFGRQPTVNDLITLTVDEAYYGQYLFKNDTWNEYSSLTKATKAQYGVTIFATMADYANTVTNKAIDPWLLKQILDEFRDEFVTEEHMEERLLDKVDVDYLTSVYYDKTVVDAKLQALQKAYIVHEDPELMTPERLQKYYGSLVYWKDGDTTKSYIVDSEGNIENLGEAGISLDGYVTTTDAKYLTLKDIKLVDDDGNVLTVQKQLDKKMDVPTGAITTVVHNDLTPSYTVVSNVNGKITSGPITATELSALKGIDVSDLATRSVELRLQALEAGGGTTGVAITNCTALPTVAPNIYTIYHLTNDTSTHKAGYYACASVDPYYGTPAWARLDNIGAMVEVAGAPATVITNPNPTTLYKNTIDLSVWMYTAGVWTKINGGGGTAADLFINGVLLEGNKTSEDLKIVKPLTKAQYDALSPTEQLNGTIYLITDDNGGGYVTPGNIIDHLYSTDPASALSANQGRILDGKITTNANAIAGFNTQVQQLGNRVVAVEGQTAAMGTQVTNLTNQVAAITDPTIPNGLAQRVAAIEQGQSSIAKLIAGIKSMFIYDSTGKILTIDPTKLDNIIW